MKGSFAIKTLDPLLIVATIGVVIAFFAGGCSTPHDTKVSPSASIELSCTTTVGNVSINHSENFSPTKNSKGDECKQVHQIRAKTGEEYSGSAISLLNEDYSASLLVAEYSNVSLEELYEDALIYPETVRENEERTISQWPEAEKTIANSKWSEPDRMTLNGRDAFWYEWSTGTSVAIYYLIDAGEEKVGYAGIIASANDMANNRESYEAILATLRTCS